MVKTVQSAGAALLPAGGAEQDDKRGCVAFGLLQQRMEWLCLPLYFAVSSFALHAMEGNER